jgi:HK97 family phage prohead protease
MTINSAPEMVENEGKKYLRGFIPYNSPSEWLGFTEILDPSAFKKTISDGSDVKALHNHDSSRILGRVKNGTLKLSNSDSGLIPEVLIDERVSYARDLWAAVERGDVDTMSFSFSVIEDKTQDENTRVIKEARLYSVDFGVPFPAYPETTSQALQRSIEEILAEPKLNPSDVTVLMETKAKIDEALARESMTTSPGPEPETLIVSETTPDETLTVLQMLAEIALSID